MDDISRLYYQAVTYPHLGCIDGHISYSFELHYKDLSLYAYTMHN